MGETDGLGSARGITQGVFRANRPIPAWMTFFGQDRDRFLCEEVLL
jgi:hypothetical protein